MAAAKRKRTPKKNPMTAMLRGRCPPSLKARLEAYLKTREDAGQVEADVVRLAVMEYLDRHEVSSGQKPDLKTAERLSLEAAEKLAKREAHQ